MRTKTALAYYAIHDRLVFAFTPSRGQGEADGIGKFDISQIVLERCTPDLGDIERDKHRAAQPEPQPVKSTPPAAPAIRTPAVHAPVLRALAHSTQCLGGPVVPCWPVTRGQRVHLPVQ